MIDKSCLFCRIIQKEIPSSIVLEEKESLSFLDIGPVNKGHVLVVPKNHSESLSEATDSDLAACMKAAKKVAGAVMKATGADGFNIIANAGRAAGQVVMHTHFHIIPRFSSDGLRHWPQGKYEGNSMDDMKNRIKTQLSLT